MAEGKTVQVCPVCDSVHIYIPVRGVHVNHLKCRKCKAVFDAPKLKNLRLFKVCPLCGSREVHKNRKKAVKGLYVCAKCKKGFDTPGTKERLETKNIITIEKIINIRRLKKQKIEAEKASQL